MFKRSLSETCLLKVAFAGRENAEMRVAEAALHLVPNLHDSEICQSAEIPRSFATLSAQLWPAHPITDPAGCVPAEQEYRPGIGVA